MKRRTFGDILLTAIFLLVGVNAWTQVLLELTGHAYASPALTTLQILIGSCASAAAWGSWIGAAWASTFALGYGLFTATMLWVLPLTMGLGPTRPNFSLGAGAITAFSVVSAWYLARPRVTRARSA